MALPTNLRSITHGSLRAPERRARALTWLSLGATAFACVTLSGRATAMPSVAMPSTAVQQTYAASTPGKGAAFDRVGARRAVSAVNVGQCSASAGTPRHVLVRVTFRPSGDVDRVSAMVTRAASACLEQQFKALHVTPYVGGQEVVDRVVTVVQPQAGR